MHLAFSWLLGLGMLPLIQGQCENPPENYSLEACLCKQYSKLCPSYTVRNLPTERALAKGSTDKVEVQLDLALYRFIDISDVDQRLSVLAMRLYSWDYPCSKPTCEELLKGTSYEHVCVDKPENSSLSIYSDPRSWTPRLAHVSSNRWTYEPSDERFKGLVYPTEGFAVAGSISRFDIQCDGFAFQKFPMDRLDCEIKFISDDAQHMVRYKLGNFTVGESHPTDFMRQTDIWELLLPLSEPRIEPYGDPGEEKYTLLTFPVSFKRKATYYIYSIFVPTFGFLILQIGALAMDGSEPDRPNFSIVVVLSFAVTLSYVFNLIPVTDERVYLVYMVTTKFMIGVLITFYNLIACMLSKMKFGRRKYMLGKKYCVEFIRVMDLVVCILAVAATVVSDIAYFTLMMKK